MNPVRRTQNAEPPARLCGGPLLGLHCIRGRVKRASGRRLSSTMDVVKHAVTKTLPAYLQTLPLPDTAAGFAELSANDWRTLAPFLGTLLAILLITARSLSGGAPKAKKTCVHIAKLVAHRMSHGLLF
jgi:Iron-containing outer mitochondrial membrane protein N-terminus